MIGTQRKISVRGWTPHFATFKGCHNHKKAACLIVLFHRKYKLNISNGATATAITTKFKVLIEYVC